MKLHSLLRLAPSMCYFACLRPECSPLTPGCQMEVSIKAPYFLTSNHSNLIPFNSEQVDTVVTLCSRTRVKSCSDHWQFCLRVLVVFLSPPRNITCIRPRTFLSKFYLFYYCQFIIPFDKYILKYFRK